MKKISLFCVAVASLLLSSCVDIDEQKATYSTKIPTLSFVSGVGETPVISPTVYGYEFDLVKGNMTLSAEVVVNANNKITFNTEANPMKVYYANVDGNMHEIIESSAEKAATTTEQQPVSNLKCELTSLAIQPPYYDGLPAPTYPLCILNGMQMAKYTRMSYQVGDNITVRTLWYDQTFAGATITNYKDKDGNALSYKDQGARYRMILDLKTNKATVIIYGAKFAEAMPQINAIVLKDLALSFDNSGFEIKGENIVPQVLEGTTTTPNPRYTLTEFSFSSRGDFSHGDCDFKLAGGFECSFSGDCFVKIEMPK